MGQETKSHLCERCQQEPRKEGGWKYCAKCKKIVAKELQESGYLQAWIRPSSVDNYAKPIYNEGSNEFDNAVRVNES